MVAGADGEYQFGYPVEAVVVGPIIVTPEPNRSAFTVRTIINAVAGTPLQGPSVTVPDGFAVLIKGRTTQTGSPDLFVANSLANTGISASRTEFVKGESFSMKIDNMDLIFFDTNMSGAVLELIAEQ